MVAWIYLTELLSLTLAKSQTLTVDDDIIIASSTLIEDDSHDKGKAH